LLDRLGHLGHAVGRHIDAFGDNHGIPHRLARALVDETDRKNGVAARLDLVLDELELIVRDACPGAGGGAEARKSDQRRHGSALHVENVHDLEFPKVHR
jgi:hypothetical protein